MSQFFDQASLVMVPSGYKDGKVYSQKPLSTDGELTFSRATSATRVASNGLIERVLTNLVLQSETFDNAAWAANLAASVTPNATTAPNGTTTADKIVEETATSQHYIGQTPTSITGVGHTISVYAKAAERSFLFLFEDSAGGRNAYFDLSNGTIGTIGGSATASITSVGNGWHRCSVTYTASGTLVRMRCAPATANGTASYTGDGTSGIFVWAAQVEVSDFGPTDYIATTSAAVSVGPVANLPRLDYLGSSCPRLLLEPQRTNLISFSDGLVAASAFGATLTKNQITSPDGYVNASLLTPSGGAAGITLVTASLSGDYTISIYLKGTVAGQKVRAFGDLQSAIADFTLTTEWARYTATFNSTNATGQSIYLLVGSYFSPSENNPFYVYGAQLEAGAYATSYIPTLGSSVTRGLESASKTGIASLIGQTEGTIFAEFTYNGAANSGVYEVILVIGTDSNNLISLNKNNITSELYAYCINGGVIQVNSVGIAGTNILGTHKVALAYKLNDYAVYLDGVQVFTDTSATVPSCSGLYVGQSETLTQQLGGTVNQALLFKTRLSNSDLATLTQL